MSYTKQLIHLIKKHQKPIWIDLYDYRPLDPYYDVYIEAADCIFLTSNQLVDYRKFMKKWMNLGKGFVVCTHANGGVTTLIGDGQWIEGTLIEQPNNYDSLQVHEQIFSSFLYAFFNEKSLEICMKDAILRTGLHSDFYDLKGEDLDENSGTSMYKTYYCS